MLRLFRKSRQITRLNLTPPAPRPGRAGLALGLIFRNEARHIGEWAEFHLSAGVSHIHAYDNGSTDGGAAVLRQVAGARLTLLPWDQKLVDARSGQEIHNQLLAYAHCLRNYGGAYRWLSFIDVDEFLVPVQADSLPAALAPLQDCRAISLPWHMFGRNGHDAPPEGGVLRNYLRRHPDPMADDKGLRNFKMIVDPCHVTSMRVHMIWTDGSDDSCNDQGQRFSAQGRESRAFYSHAAIQLNHYYTRSDQELRAKIARGPNLTTPDADHLRRVLRKVAAIEAGEVEDRLVLDYLARRAAASGPQSGE